MLVVATRDSSVLALDGDTGKALNSGTVHPKKPSKALFMEVFGKNQLFTMKHGDSQCATK